MSDYKKINRKLQILEYEKAIILPRKSIDGDYPMWGLGGVCDSDNQFVKQSFYEGDWATHGGKYDWEEEEYLDEEVIYIGMFFSHWGHFLVDLSNRFWALPILVSRNPNIKVAYLGEETPKGNNLRLFELLGITGDRLIHITNPTRFSKVYLPEQGYKPNAWYSQEYIELYDYLVKEVLESDYDFSKVKGLKNVYFTRRQFAKATCSEFGEEYFEKVFCSNGFVPVAPEKLSLDEQIYIWNNAEKIVCINGTIPLNVIFSCNKNLELIVLNKTSIPHENPHFLSYTRGIRGVYIDAYKEPYKKYPKSLGEGPFLLYPTEQFGTYVSNNYVINSNTYKIINKEKRKYYLYIFSVKRRLKNFFIKIFYR